LEDEQKTGPEDRGRRGKVGDELGRTDRDASPPTSGPGETRRARGALTCHDGFTLIETLVALAVLYVVLIGLASGLMLARRASEALREQRQVDRMLEASLETLRVGGIALRNGPVAMPSAEPGFPVALQLEVAPIGSAGLFEVTVYASYLRRGATLERSLTSLVWRP
jgi:type II secretory pathway pseudopilin PulG